MKGIVTQWTRNQFDHNWYNMKYNYIKCYNILHNGSSEKQLGNVHPKIVGCMCRRRFPTQCVFAIGWQSMKGWVLKRLMDGQSFLFSLELLSLRYLMKFNEMLDFETTDGWTFACFLQMSFAVGLHLMKYWMSKRQMGRQWNLIRSFTTFVWMYIILISNLIGSGN